MRRRGTWLAGLASLLLGVTGVLLASAGENPPSLYTIELVVTGNPGETVLTRIEVSAGTRGEAEAAARDALVAVAPRAAVVPTGSASAAWLPWSWKWESPEIPVPVAYNPTGAPDGVGPAAVIAGLQAWSSVATSSFRFTYAGITDNSASILELGPDGENVVSWASLPCERGCVLGLTSKNSAHEVDMLLNSNPEAALQLGGAALDWRTVILHELGHVAGLEHSCPVPFGPCTEAEAAAVMYFAYVGTLRKLAPDDIAGLSALYPLGTEAPGPSPTPAPGVTPALTPYPELTVILERGWNLVVLPPGPMEPVGQALACMAALYEFRDGAWTTWIRDLPQGLQGFTGRVDGRAYWAWADGTCAHIFP